MGCDLFDNMVSNFILERECWLEEKRSESEFIPSLQNAEDDVLSSRSTASPIFVSCRYYKSLVGQLRDRSLRILSFVRLLLSDLEICSSYNLSSQANLESLVSRLQNTSHCLVCFPSFHLDYIVFCDKNSARNVEFVSNLLNFTCSRRESELPDVCVYEIGYLIIFSPDSLPDFCPDTWRGPRIYVNLDADIQMSLRYLRLNSAACLVALNSAALPEMRNRISRSFCDHDKCLLELDEEQFTCHETIYDHIEHLKEKAKAVCEMLWDTFTGGMTEKVLDGEKIESLDSYERESLRATLLQSFDLAFEYYRELFRFIPRKSRAWLAQNTLKWTKQWASFVRSSFSPGDGEVPKWAFQSFGFLLLACDPQLRQYLSANDHTDLLKTARSIILYIKGTSEKGRKKLTDDETDGHSPCRSSTYHRSLLNSDSSASLTSEDRSTRVMEALRKVDVNRNIHMQEERRIGHVIERGRESLSFETYFHPRKRAPFKWQRLEKKIGSGKFGTVYVVMNLDNNCLMAMKQIQIERNHKALHALVEEVENLRSLDHPNLVKYYAVEVHREEIMIFMEYCPEGTLEKICCEGLLDMRCVRKYTHFLLKAVEYIHSMKIVHRDIKPANIFLGKKDVLKLGDFGSSVRLREISTARGEVVEWVGTVPYMAPELHTFGRRDPGEEITGYGRAADIWSVGCVVLEMCTGKPPWSECDHQLQIVYNVGSGMHPTIPPKIRADAQCLSFLEACFIVDRRKRATAEQLRQHPFANIHVAECFEDNRRPVTFT
ncbi:hypothetical protein AB6A40_005341 [Gnathostoma spinigerum]|uniref:Protein kinase domain-containing protein n=1 Tax=Gnathostoma spinigerum TaxID=75299 RepID=A0ABD6EPM6_9BILA